MSYTPKFCVRCIELGQKPKIRAVGSVWCREHRNEYQRRRYRNKVIAQREYERTHNEFGEEIDEFGWTATDYEVEKERIESDPRYQRPAD